ncbi:hypothetical protein KCU83_g107, partial [Aureobasidium melanogenum]
MRHAETRCGLRTNCIWTVVLEVVGHYVNDVAFAGWIENGRFGEIKGSECGVLHLRLHLLLSTFGQPCRHWTPWTHVVHSVSKSKTYTMKRHTCFRKQRRIHRESTSPIRVTYLAHGKQYPDMMIKRKEMARNDEMRHVCCRE